MQKYETTKLYLGYPVFILSTRDDHDNILVSTISSSYSLGNKFVIGLGKGGNTAQTLKLEDTVALNFLSEQQGLLSDIAGKSSGSINHKKAAELNVSFDYYNDNIPYIKTSMITIIGKITHIFVDENYLHIFIDIVERLVADELLDAKGRLIYEKMNPLIYLGDDKRRVYKYTSNEIIYSGGFLKNQKKSFR